MTKINVRLQKFSNWIFGKTLDNLIHTAVLMEIQVKLLWTVSKTHHPSFFTLNSSLGILQLSAFQCLLYYLPWNKWLKLYQVSIFYLKAQIWIQIRLVITFSVIRNVLIRFLKDVLWVLKYLTYFFITDVCCKICIIFTR